MDEEWILGALDQLDPALIAEADAPAVRRRSRKRTVLVLAAALAALLCLMGAAGVLERFQLTSGVGIFQGSHRFSADFSTAEPPFVLEDGRVIFTADGGLTDITGLIGPGTPHIYRMENSALPAWIIVGGPPETPGYAEVWVNQGEVSWVYQFWLESSDSLASGMGQSDAQEFRDGWWETGVEELAWYDAAIETLRDEIDALLPTTPADLS